VPDSGQELLSSTGALVKDFQEYFLILQGQRKTIEKGDFEAFQKLAAAGEEVQRRINQGTALLNSSDSDENNVELRYIAVKCVEQNRTNIEFLGQRLSNQKAELGRLCREKSVIKAYGKVSPNYSRIMERNI